MDSALLIIDLIGKIFHAIWTYDIITVSGNHIRVGNVVIASCLFIVGLKYSKYFATVIKQYVKNKVSDDRDAANALEKIAIYICLLLFVITLLEIANVPLSTFAFVGGALAIGIGLGAQTIINNFISSLIIMVERPIKIGDIIEIDGVTGIVNSVGARCITMVTFSNVEVLVPNSRIMQNTIVNWTLSDNYIRNQLEINIKRNFFDDKDIESFLNNLNKIFFDSAFSMEEYHAEMHVVKIEEDNIKFLLSTYCDALEIKAPEHLKNELNLFLIKHLKDCPFSLEYPKIIELKYSDKYDK